MFLLFARDPSFSQWLSPLASLAIFFSQLESPRPTESESLGRRLESEFL